MLHPDITALLAHDRRVRATHTADEHRRVAPWRRRRHTERLPAAPAVTAAHHPRGARPCPATVITASRPAA